MFCITRQVINLLKFAYLFTALIKISEHRAEEIGTRKTSTRLSISITIAKSCKFFSVTWDACKVSLGQIIEWFKICETLNSHTALDVRFSSKLSVFVYLDLCTLIFQASVGHEGSIA